MSLSTADSRPPGADTPQSAAPDRFAGVSLTDNSRASADSRADGNVDTNEHTAQAGADGSSSLFAGDALPVSRDVDGFDYKPVPVLATVALFLAFCSFAALISLTGIFVGVMAILVSLAAIVVIATSRGELSGMWLSAGALAIALGLTAVGAKTQYDDYVGELPDGYQRINFPRDISEKQLIVTPQGYALPPDVRPLIGAKLFLKGYMWESRITHNMTEFILLKDNGDCCMGGDPKPWDNIRVVLPKGEHVNYISGLTSVWGTLRINTNPTPDDPAVYLLEADGVERARTTF